MAALMPLEIPLSAQPQTLQVALAGTTYTLTVKWNDQNQSWTVDIADAAGNNLVTGIPMVTGADLLGQFDYLGISGALVAQSDFNPSAVPTFANLGSTGHLYFVAGAGL